MSEGVKKVTQKGWVKLHRKLLDSPIWNDLHYMKLWMYCLLKASHKTHEQIIGSKVIKLEPGQFPTGRKALARDLNDGMKPKQQLSESTWWRHLNNLEKWGKVNIKKTNKYSVVTVVNWSLYQENEHHLNNSWTANEHQMNTKWTSIEHQMNTNKNDKNDKNVKNERSNNTTTTDNARDAIAFYQNNFGMATPYVAEDILYWINDIGDEMVIEAMTRSLERNKTNWGYVKSILRSWHNKGIKTIEQARAEQVEFENQRQQRYQSNNKRSHEVVPDWFNDRKQNKHQSDKVTHIEDVDIEKEKQEMMDFIKKASGS